MQVFFILFSVHFAVYQYINSKCLYRTHVNLDTKNQLTQLVKRKRFMQPLGLFWSKQHTGVTSDCRPRLSHPHRQAACRTQRH